MVFVTESGHGSQEAWERTWASHKAVNEDGGDIGQHAVSKVSGDNDGWN